VLQHHLDRMMEKVAGDRHRVSETRRPSGDVVLQRQAQELGADIRLGSSKETVQQRTPPPDNRTDEPHTPSVSRRRGSTSRCGMLARRRVPHQRPTPRASSARRLRPSSASKPSPFVASGGRLIVDLGAEMSFGRCWRRLSPSRRRRQPTAWSGSTTRRRGSTGCSPAA
jgi:hypothetical protein